VVNGGGLINVSFELAPGGYSREQSLAKVSKIYDILLRVFQVAGERGITTARAANLLAEQRIRKALEQKRIYRPSA